MKKLIKYISLNKIKFLWILFIGIVSTLLEIVSPLIFMKIVDELAILNYKAAIFMIYKLVPLSLITIILKTYFNYSKKIFSEIISFTIIGDISKNISKQNLKQYKDEGTYLSWFKNDINVLKMNYFIALFDVVNEIVYFLVSLLVIFYLSKIMFLVVIINLVLMLILSNYFGINLQNKFLDFSKYSEKYNYKFLNIINGFEVFFFNLKFKELKKVLEENFNEMKNEKIKLLKFQNIVIMILTIFSIFSQETILFISCLLFIKGNISLGVVVGISNLVGPISNSIPSILGLIMEFKNSEVISKKIIKEIDIFDKEIGNELENIDEIRFENYTYKEVLKNLNIKFEKNKKYLLIGESGSGKSLLMKSLLKEFTDYTGKISINKLNLEDISIKSIYDKIAYISSDTHIFNETIVENINLISSEINNVEKIINSLKLRHLIDKEELFEEKISTGERQRINIARFLIKNYSVYIIDEATSNLDFEIRELIEDIILSKKDAIIIYVSHFIDDKLKNKFDEIINLI